jgi:hypothetical protein
MPGEGACEKMATREVSSLVIARALMQLDLAQNSTIGRARFGRVGGAFFAPSRSGAAATFRDRA